MCNLLTIRNGFFHSRAVPELNAVLFEEVVCSEAITSEAGQLEAEGWLPWGTH